MSSKGSSSGDASGGHSGDTRDTLLGDASHTHSVGKSPEATLGERSDHWARVNREHAAALMREDPEGAWWHMQEAKRLERMNDE